MDQKPAETSVRSIPRLKADAKALVKELGIPHTKALDSIAKQRGFQDWKSLLQNEQETTPPKALQKTKPPKVSNPLIGVDLIHHNRALLAKLGLDHSELIITATGIKKSIMDAIAPLRDYFDFHKYHDYKGQVQGVIERKQAKLITLSSVIPTTVSLYRPKTKNGDPRIWISKLTPHVSPNDTLALILAEGVLYVINISKININDHIDLFKALAYQTNIIAFELIEKLRILAKKGPLKSVKSGDTGIGMTIEHALGISANSSKKPDYKGIELKAARATANKTRSTLFAQVSNWDLSPLKSSAAIVDKYGYMRDNDLKLYCSLSTQTINSQGLIFEYLEDKDLLVEKHVTDGEIAVWKGSTLRERLLEKHKETFWIRAESIFISGVEHFVLKSVIHTKNPLLGQFIPLLQEGIITMDHLIKRENGTGHAREKGPLFKINPKHLNLLFPEQVEYELEKG